jgi:hypothetical protein
MSNYDEFLNNKPRPTAQGKKKKSASKDQVWNILTVVMLLMMLCSCGVIYSIYTNPYSGLNPFRPTPPYTPTVTPTWTPLGFEATWTSEPTIQPTATLTPRPTFTLEPTFTPFKLATSTPMASATPAVSPTRTPKPTGLPYSVTITAVNSTTYRADTSCGTMYVAGQAIDNKKNPMLGYIVRLGGNVPGKSFDNTTMTGIAIAYGQSGFEFDLGVPPVDSKNSLWIQMFDQSNTPLSEKVPLTTYSDCGKNLIYVRFTQK